MTRAEARKVYRNTHLYWSVGPSGRCWGNSLMSARAMAKGVSHPVRGPMARPLLPVVIAPPDPLEILPEALADIMPPLNISPIEWRWPR